jgi:hypothetical protein
MTTAARRVGAVDDRSDTNEFVVPGRAEPQVSPESVLADIARDLAATSAAEEPVSLVVPNRSEFYLQFRGSIDFDDLRLWVKRSREKGGNDPHALRLAIAVLSNTNVGMTYKGEPAMGRDDRPLTLAHPELHAMLGAPVGGTPAAIRKFYGADGHIIMTMRRILEEAGYTDEVELEGDGPLGV